MNIERSSLTAVTTHNQRVWAIGGALDNSRYFDTIEVYQDRVWTVIDVILPVSCASVGVCCIGNGLLLIGGKNREKNCMGSVYYFDTGSFIMEEMESLESECYFSLNQFIVDEDAIDGLGDNANDGISKTIVRVSNLQKQKRKNRSSMLFS